MTHRPEFGLDLAAAPDEHAQLIEAISGSR